MREPLAVRTDGPLVNRWWQLVACLVAMMAIANLQYAWMLFTLSLTQRLHATLSAVHLAFTLFILAETWLVPVEGYLVDRLGAWRVVTAGGLLVGVSWVGSGLAASLRTLWVAYTIGGIGAGAVYGACVGTALKWFPDRRGLAAGLTAGSYGFGTALTVIRIRQMIAARGDQAAFITWGVLQGIVVMGAAWFMRPPPAGWQPAGWERLPAMSRQQVYQTAVSSTPLQMVQSGIFWLMYLLMTLVAFGGLMVTAQLKPIAATYGLDQTVVLFGVTAIGLALILDRILNGVTRPFWRWISDRLGRYHTMTLAFGLEALAILILLQLVQHPLCFIILTGVTFFAWGEIFSLFPAAISDVFGPDYATTNYGIQYTAKGTASIASGWSAAKILEATGSWIPVFWSAVSCDLLAAGLAFCWLRGLVARRIARQQEAALAEVSPRR